METVTKLPALATPFTLRQAAGESDSTFLYELKKQVLRGYVEKIWGWDEAVQLQYHAANYHPELTSIIMVNGNNAGTVEIDNREQELFICSLYLLPQYQNQGIGSAVITQCMEQAKQQGKRLSLEVLLSNTRARELYLRLGFTAMPQDNDIKIFMYKDFAS
ncbi:GNAT family N-acetyltransferase [Deminuibacter soli]|uniref:GNAT family N-acetyltransferase n=1 Tax=Deminuibacter soli TaxID=2291815 RepID=A0A3E1NM53_9BACT|nr:GNAT family N-acetyltransferase [Deminuibacter soli]RFM28992.1 GNAT family N-acetyltransferase [Deminuibacter soli]